MRTREPFLNVGVATTLYMSAGVNVPEPVEGVRPWSVGCGSLSRRQVTVPMARSFDSKRSVHTWLAVW